MGGAPVVIALVGLLFPIALLLGALLLDVAIVAWSLYQWWRNTVRPRMATAIVTSLHRAQAGSRVAITPTPH